MFNAIGLIKTLLIKSKTVSIYALAAVVLTLFTAGTSYAQAGAGGGTGAGAGTGAGTGAGGGGTPAASISVGTIDDSRIFCVFLRLINLIEGNGGALIMIGAGIATVISAAFGAFKAATSLFAVAASAFVLRSIVVIFFNVGVDPDSQGTLNCSPGGGLGALQGIARSF